MVLINTENKNTEKQNVDDYNVSRKDRNRMFDLNSVFSQYLNPVSVESKIVILGGCCGKFL